MSGIIYLPNILKDYSYFSMFQYFFVLLMNTMLWMYHILLIHWLMDCWVVSTFLAVLNNAVVNTHVQVFVWIYVYFSLGGISDHSTLLNHLKSCQTVFQSVCSFLSFHQECTRVMFGLHPCQHWRGQSFNFSHWVRYIVKPHCDFNLYIF